ncbi:NAD-dependent succinate-semialdehyde dehydrogenase [Actinospongicola halichondriae]|uniref:NAD-dependent succinate-semialdehyde dehydrogenase n=1 Tax=Actinospongicola halichondriae TaxID=3236844 RepID=UPI003D378815
MSNTISVACCGPRKGENQHSMNAYDVVDPATETVVATVEAATPHEIATSVDRAAAAFSSWSTTAPRARAELLHRAFQAVRSRRDDLAETIVRENGKPIAEARGEVDYAAEFLRWFAEEAVRMEGGNLRAPSGSGRILTLPEPIGVALLITPWNFPLAMLARKIAPALAAGCTVVAKPAEATPLTALRLVEVLRDVGLPEGVVELIVTDDPGSAVGQVLADSRVRKLSFTGSTEVGRMLLQQAADRVLDCSMELGGNAPFVVFADADLDAAVAGAMVAKMRHNAQACTAANRFYVESPVAKEFARRLSLAMAGLALGRGLDPTTTLGPLIDAEARDRSERLTQIAVDAGASVLTGGRRPPHLDTGYFFEPTVVTGVRHGDVLGSSEIFGPIAPVISFDPEDDVIGWANDVDQGLVSYVYTADLGRAMDFASRSEVGMVGINRGTVSDPAAPFGGAKQSGLGREGGHEGLLAYCETKYISVDW